jgi:hypothetical protein
MRKYPVFFPACLIPLVLSPVVQAQNNLQPESRQEFQRVFGSTSLGAPAADSPRSGTAAPAASNLQQESANEFRRIFGQNVLSGTVELQKMATPSTIDSTALHALTASTDKRRYLVLWHLIAVDLTAIDHRAIIGASPTTYQEQFGPARAARALALIHQAMFEAANAFDHKYTSSLSGGPALPTAGASQDAAIIEAAYQVIVWLYPGLNDQSFDVGSAGMVCTINKFSLSTYYTCSLGTIGNDSERNAGIAVGRAIAGKIIAEHSHDGGERLEPVWGKDFIPRQAPGDTNYPFTQWQRDPVSQLATALGRYWGQVRPFAMSSGFQFRPPEDKSPAALFQKIASDPTNLPSYNAVYKWGRETRLDPMAKITQPPLAGDGFFIAQFWAYDATANLCAPPRLYNQIAAKVLEQIEKTPTDGYPGVIDVNSITDIARFYALVNIAMADAAVAAWDSKYHFQFPRPVTYIRAQEEKLKGTVTTKWFPVGAQVTNSDQTFNITPPFPAYPSGHATFGGALVGILRQFMKPTATFLFLSDEFNGKNKDVFNYFRCSSDDKLTPGKFCDKNGRSFTLNCAERENADSRVFMGVHWVFDADDGIEQGNKVAREVYRRAMKPVDAQGQPYDAPSQVFSANYNVLKKRSDLVCPNLTFPIGWDDPDPSKGFGPLAIPTTN